METQIHPSAVVDPSAELGEGVMVGPHAVPLALFSGVTALAMFGGI